MPGFAFPSMGPFGFGSPSSQSGHIDPDWRYYAQLRLPPALLGSLRCSLSLPNTLSCFLSLCPVSGSPSGWKPPYVAEALDQPVPFIFWRFGGRQVALPSSRVVPLYTCPALRPRWFPADSPFRLRDCCLPHVGMRRLSQFLLWLSFCPHLCSISGFYVTAYVLALLSFTRPLLVLHVSFATDLLARLWSDGT